MKLEHEDKEAIVEIAAARYFSGQNWKWVNIRTDIDKIFKAYEDLREQYNEYPYMSKDWYVANSASKSIHMCEMWDELKELVDFLNAYGKHFDFLVKQNNRRSLCITSEKGELTSEQKDAISAARRIRCNVFVFTASVPDNIEFDLLQIGGGM